MLTARRRRAKRRLSGVAIGFELALGVALLGAAVLAGLVFVHRPWPNRLDAKGFSLFPAIPNSVLYHDIAELGSFRVLVCGIAVAFALSVWRDRARALACVLGPIAAVVITERIAKPLVGRHLSVLGGDSFPSGTVTAITALAVVAFLIAPVLLRPLVALVGAASIVAVAVAVIGMRWHYPTDVLGGLFVASGGVLVFDALFHLPGLLRAHAHSSRARQHPYAGAENKLLVKV